MKAWQSTGNNNGTTPSEIFEKLNEIFNFTIDICASEYNKKCERYFSEKDTFEQNGFILFNERMFCNPPFESKYQNSIIESLFEMDESNLAVVLIPARTETKRFQRILRSNRTSIYFIPYRISFGGYDSSSPFSCCLVFFNCNYRSKLLLDIDDFKDFVQIDVK